MNEITCPKCGNNNFDWRHDHPNGKDAYYVCLECEVGVYVRVATGQVIAPIRGTNPPKMWHPDPESE